MFLRPEITDPKDWVYIDTRQGGYFFPSDFVGAVPTKEWDSKVWAANLMQLDPKDIFGVGMQYGHGSRLSAPGYLDCTDWTVHDTIDAAAAYLLDHYYDMPEEAMDAEELGIVAELTELLRPCDA